MGFDVLAHVRNIVLAALFLILIAHKIELAHQHQNISINHSSVYSQLFNRIWDMEYLHTSQSAASVSGNDFLDEVCFCFCCTEIRLLKH